MRLDVIQLKDFYSGTELGRTTKQLINRVLEKKVDTKNVASDAKRGVDVAGKEPRKDPEAERS